MRDLLTMAAVFTLALAQVGLTCRGLAQQPVAPQKIAVRVLGAADGLPRPGVMIHTAALGEDPRVFTADGLVVVEDAQVRRLRRATVVRTDPEGRAWLDLGIQNSLYRLSLGGAHYLSAPPKVVDGELVMRAVDQEPVGVRAFDGDGKPLRRFAVALHGNGEDLSIALTDDTGRAVLAAPPGFAARLTVLPVGWVGSKDGFPTIAESLAGRRSAVLRLPPHGSLRVRAVRGGQPVKVRTSAVTLTEPETHEPLHSRNLSIGNSVDASGVEYPLVGLGIEFHASTNFDGTSRRLTGAGPRVAGERAVCDVELGFRPAIRLRLRGAGKAAVGLSLRFTAVTDGGRVQAFGSVDAEGVVKLDFGGGLPGKRLLRLEVDGEQRAAADRAGVVWHVVIAGDYDMTGDRLDLGEVEWQARPPQMRGRVVDERGAPIANASVVVARNGLANSGVIVPTDTEGRFEFIGPLFRGEDGIYQDAVATARLGDHRSEPSPPGAAGADVVLTIRRDVPPPPPRGTASANGSLIARIANVPEGTFGVQLVDRGNFGKHPTATRRADDGYTEYLFEGVRPGRYVLCAVSSELGRFPVLDALEVPAGGKCEDERLTLGLMDHVVVATVRVDDAAGVPMAGVRVTGDVFLRQTGGTGTARIPMLRGVATSALLEATGMRSQRIAELVDGEVVVLTPPGTLSVTVHGIPADLPREHVEVWVRDEVLVRFAGPRAAVGEGSVVRVPMPARGRYLITVLVGTGDGKGGKTWTGVYRSAEALVVGDGPDQQAEVRLDEAAVLRLREAVARLP